MTVTGAINNGVVISGLTLFGGALNTSFEPAAGVWITGNASVRIINSTIASNTNAAGSGGGLYVAAGASLDLIHSRIFNNSAAFFSQADGGGIWVGGVVNLTGDSFSLNTADQNGGNIYADRNATLVVSGTQVLNGKAMRGGGLLARFLPGPLLQALLDLLAEFADLLGDDFVGFAHVALHGPEQGGVGGAQRGGFANADLAFPRRVEGTRAARFAS